MSRWLHRLSTKARALEAVDRKRQVHPPSGRSSTSSDAVSTFLRSIAIPAHSDTGLLYRAKALADREDVLSERSYHLLVWKLKLMEEETSLELQYDELSREQDDSPEGAQYFAQELAMIFNRGQQIKERKKKLSEQHEQLETAIELLADDKGRWAEEYQQLYRLQ